MNFEEKSNEFFKHFTISLIYGSCIICLAGHLLVCFEFQAKRWVDEKKTFFSRKIVGDNYWSWSFLVSSLKIVPYATTDRNSATAGDDDVTTSGLDVVICGVKTDIGNKSGRRRNLYCVLYILYFFTYFTTSTWGGHKEAWRIICNYRSERKNTISADAFFSGKSGAYCWQENR